MRNWSIQHIEIVQKSDRHREVQIDNHKWRQQIKRQTRELEKRERISFDVGRRHDTGKIFD